MNCCLEVDVDKRSTAEELASHRFLKKAQDLRTLTPLIQAAHHVLHKSIWIWMYSPPLQSVCAFSWRVSYSIQLQPHIVFLVSFRTSMMGCFETAWLCALYSYLYIGTLLEAKVYFIHGFYFYMKGIPNILASFTYQICFSYHQPSCMSVITF